MTRSTIDINVDTGESFGRWRLGDDAAILRHVTSANIACGYHAGDPATMRTTVALAVEHGVQIGAHVSLPDLLGFGRRRMAVSGEEVRDMCTYQIGALMGFAAAAGATVRHVKPHGALYVMCSSDSELATAVAETMKAIDPDLTLLLLGDPGVSAARAAGVHAVPEAFPDLEYTPDGQLIVERTKQAWEPARVAERAVRLAREGRIDTRDDGTLEIDAPTLCVHGDAPNAVEVARAVREALEAAGVAVEPLSRDR
jgi:5-oxoprolinase (ATP-hydrolysing) subunit A